MESIFMTLAFMAMKSRLDIERNTGNIRETDKYRAKLHFHRLGRQT